MRDRAHYTPQRSFMRAAKKSGGEPLPALWLPTLYPEHRVLILAPGDTLFFRGVFHGGPGAARNNQNPVRAARSRSGRTAGRFGPASDELFSKEGPND